MKKIFVPLLLLLAGLGVGGGAAYATAQLIGAPAGAGDDAAQDHGDPTFVTAGSVLAPLVFADGRLAGYMKFDVALEAPEAKAEFITARLPILMHAVNLRTYKTPMASGPDGMLPDIDTFRKIVEAAVPDAFGEGVVDRVAVTLASPV